MLTVYFIRHGLVHNPSGVAYHRRPGFVLGDAGRAEVHAAAEFLRDVPLRVIFHTPLERTLQTAEIINRYHGAPLVLSELMHEWGEHENAEMVQARTQRFWKELTGSEYATAAVVSHRDAIRPLLLWLSGDLDPRSVHDELRMPLPTAGVYRVLTMDHPAHPPEIRFVFAPTTPAPSAGR